jgi:hypothetical protein
MGFQAEMIAKAEDHSTTGGDSSEDCSSYSPFHLRKLRPTRHGVTKSEALRTRPPQIDRLDGSRAFRVFKMASTWPTDFRWIRILEASRLAMPDRLRVDSTVEMSSREDLAQQAGAYNP